jgi:PAS domain-containing protein
VPTEDHHLWAAPELVRHAVRLLDSHRHWTGRELVTRGRTAWEDARRLWDAPVVVVSHGTEADPKINYANRAALALWETTWGELIGVPSRFTAEPVEREAREELLRRTRDFGHVEDYRGVRISRAGRRFLIRQATVWNVRDDSGEPAGQAAAFSDWEWLSSGGDPAG